MLSWYLRFKGSGIWRPFHNNFKVYVENVHRKFLKCLHYKTYGTYPERWYNNQTLLDICELHTLHLKLTQNGYGERDPLDGHPKLTPIHVLVTSGIT